MTIWEEFGLSPVNNKTRGLLKRINVSAENTDRAHTTCHELLIIAEPEHAADVPQSSHMVQERIASNNEQER